MWRPASVLVLALAHGAALSAEGRSGRADARLGTSCDQFPEDLLLAETPSLYSDSKGWVSQRFGVYCDDGRSVAGIWLRSPMDASPPEARLLAWEVSATGDRGNRPGQLVRKVALEGDRLWIYTVGCGMCRVIRATLFVGDLTRLSEQQLREVQEAAGLPAWPPLPSGRRFEAACRTGESSDSH